MKTAEQQRQVMANNLNCLLNIKNKKQADLVRDLGIPESTINCKHILMRRKRKWKKY